METASTACMPSKCRLTPRATSSGRDPAAGSLSATGLPATTSVSTGTCLLHRGHQCGRREDAPALRNDPSRAEPEEAENQPADAHPLDRRDQPLRPERRQVASRLLEAHWYEDCAQYRPIVVA